MTTEIINVIKYALVIHIWIGMQSQGLGFLANHNRYDMHKTQ
jgi:hypothetical protein